MGGAAVSPNAYPYAVTQNASVAKEFWYSARPKRYGAIAQLGERLHGMQEVDGSIPSGSTK
jgi:hypothetical protein